MVPIDEDYYQVLRLKLHSFFHKKKCVDLLNLHTKHFFISKKLSIAPGKQVRSFIKIMTHIYSGPSFHFGALRKEERLSLRITGCIALYSFLGVIMSVMASDKACAPVRASRPFPKQKLRELVLQALYALEIDPEGEDSLVSLLMTEASVSKKNAAYALMFCRAIRANQPDLDALLDATIRTTTLARLTIIERNILRMMLFEHQQNQDCCPVPVAILIAETTRLIKKFSYSEGSSLILAVLGSIFDHPAPALDAPLEPTSMCG
ncbi:N utilization substance protein B [Chlamydia trachomatis A2497]|nr:N utilization substance protein B [Chlamydia trachomatis A2497]CCP48231.1 transcription antitermination protein NusB [Chlamydia trachomatis A/363]CCP49130.1 transcription antitermination protein NusB [Chlamydia trachomatis A/5291]CCP50028.1 transcription antitermination protein NusB [Chlamydia trachomatis A/7249]